jgi:3-dehydroquinate dehydratase-1
MDLSFNSFVLAAVTPDLRAIEASVADETGAGALEFRMDLATDPLDTLADYDGVLPVIATNRAAREGGEAGDEAARLEALEVAVSHEHVAAVDVELAAVTDGNGDRVLAAAEEYDVTTIVSKHDFDVTPPTDAMAELLLQAADRGDVAKLAVTAESRGDVLDLLRATYERTEAGDRVATMAMGEPGRHSRGVAPLYGSKIGYAPVDPERTTAPGQYDLATLADLIETLGLQLDRKT